MARHMARIDTGRQREVRVEQLQPRTQRSELVDGARLRVVAGDEVLPVGPVRTVGRPGEHGRAVVRHPANVVEMQVGENDVRHVRWGDSVVGQRGEQVPSRVPAIVERAHTGVNEYGPLAGADAKAAERETQGAVRFKMLGVAGPRILHAGTGQDVRRDLDPHPVPHRQNLYVTDLHAHSPVSGNSLVATGCNRSRHQNIPDHSALDLSFLTMGSALPAAPHSVCSGASTPGTRHPTPAVHLASITRPTMRDGPLVQRSDQAEGDHAFPDRPSHDRAPSLPAPACAGAGVAPVVFTLAPLGVPRPPGRRAGTRTAAGRGGRHRT
ncbi:hypothetical protein SCANM63S_04872 [Streptomyces canarius]